MLNKNKNYKFLIGVVIGITTGFIMSFTVVYASIKYKSSDVYYNNSNSTLTSADVQSAIDELAEKYKKINKKCPDGYTCTKTASTAIIELFNNATDQTTVTTAGDEEIIQASSVSLMQDSFGNIRYYGAEPNNYVSFNDETWRIIGVFEVEDEDGNTEQRIKIIRDESIGSYAYDSNEVNDWSTSSLNEYLNEEYYYELTDEAQEMIGSALYYLGGHDDDIEGLYANDYYTFERGEEVPDGNETIWTGNIGIMYPSDYGYGTDLSICTYDLLYYDESECYENDWLYSWLYSELIGIDEWLISPNSSRLGIAFRVVSEGYVVNVYDDVGIDWGVRPVLYLKSDVSIVSGSGTVDDKYILG